MCKLLIYLHQIGMFNLECKSAEKLVMVSRSPLSPVESNRFQVG